VRAPRVETEATDDADLAAAAAAKRHWRVVVRASLVETEATGDAEFDVVGRREQSSGRAGTSPPVACVGRDSATRGPHAARVVTRDPARAAAGVGRPTAPRPRSSAILNSGRSKTGSQGVLATRKRHLVQWRAL